MHLTTRQGPRAVDRDPSSFCPKQKCRDDRPRRDGSADQVSAHIGRVIRFFFQPSIKRMFLFADCGSGTAQAEGLFRCWIGVTLAKTYERRESFEPHRPIFASRVVLCAPYNVGFVESFVYNFVRWVWRCLWQRLETTNQSTKTTILLINKRKTGQFRRSCTAYFRCCL